MGHIDLRLGQIVYTLVFYNILFSLLLPLDGFQFIFLLRDSENDQKVQKLVPRFFATVLYTGAQNKNVVNPDKGVAIHQLITDFRR